jgi:hypothetical protein
MDNQTSEDHAKAAYEACIARQEDPSIHPPWEQLGEETQQWWITGKCPEWWNE